MAGMTSDVTWKSAVATVLERLPREFELADILRYREELAAQFPLNKHVDAKVRQTLQILRDRGALEFLSPGRYRKTFLTPRYSCMIDMAAAADYTSRAQLARAVIEPWAEYNLYCLACPSDDISALPNNTKVADLRCPNCEATYQLKSTNGRFGNLVHGADYKTYAAAAETGRFPHLVLVEWDARFSCVYVVRAIPGSTVTKEHIVARNALSATARRAGWRGCLIDVAGLPWIELVTPEFRDPGTCRTDWTARAVTAIR